MSGTIQLNVPIPFELHERLRKAVYEGGVSKRKIVISALDYALPKTERATEQPEASEE